MRLLKIFKKLKNQSTKQIDTFLACRYISPAFLQIQKTIRFHGRPPTGTNVSSPHFSCKLVRFILARDRQPDHEQSFVVTCPLASPKINSFAINAVTARLRFVLTLTVRSYPLARFLPESRCPYVICLSRRHSVPTACCRKPSHHGKRTSSLNPGCVPRSRVRSTIV